MVLVFSCDRNNSNFSCLFFLYSQLLYVFDLFALLPFCSSALQATNSPVKRAPAATQQQQQQQAYSAYADPHNNQYQHQNQNQQYQQHQHQHQEQPAPAPSGKGFFW